MNPFAQLAIDDEEDDYVQPVASNKPPKKSIIFIIQHIKSENLPNSKRYRRPKKSLKNLLILSMRLSPKKLNKISKIGIIDPDLRRN